jgi:AcrR family transcriptional regulator
MTEPSRPGRWRSGAESRQRILDAARALFRSHGYARTTVRAVAAEAGVDPAMVFYFFGSKQGLFGAVADMSADLPAAIDAIFSGGLDGIGERLVRTLLENLDRSDRAPLPLVTGASQETLVRDYVDREITGRLVSLLDGPDAEMRAGMVNVQLLGLTVARYLLRLEPIASAPVDALVSRFGPLIQEIVDEGRC